ncbi:MAG: hypothetical protein HS113_08050 [Verrucomicrobiales bacterium]|nr:hypothetical protein [Verrucomicrobiales bacterium]
MNGSLVQRARAPESDRALAACEVCGLPLDSEPFDESGFGDVPGPGQEVLLARFELSPQYCGVLENFSQYVGDRQGLLSGVMETPGLLWQLRVNHRPLYPYVRLEHIVNPWGFGSFPVVIRLEEAATLEFVVRNLNAPAPPAGRIARVGGRLTGRFWYNPRYGDATSHARPRR